MTSRTKFLKNLFSTSKLLSQVSLGVILTVAGIGAANAQSFTIQSGQTVTTPQGINGNAFTGTIEEGGALNVTGQANAINVQGVGNTIVNSGTINFDTTGRPIFSTSTAIDSLAGTGNRFTNNGTINLTAQGAAIHTAVGVRLQTLDSFINNGVLSSATTSGLSNDGYFGVNIVGTDVTVTNNGLISVFEGEAIINTTGDRSTILNNGTLRTTRRSAGSTNVIQIATPSSTVVNTSLVEGIGEVDGIVFFDPGGNESRGTITNSGSIIVPLNRFAVRFLGVDSRDTLNLNDGGVIQGKLDFGSGADTFNVGQGISLDYTFEAGGVPETINAGAGAVVTQIGNRVIVTDPSSVQIGQSLGAEVAGAVLDVLENRVDRTHDALEEGSVGSSNGVANPFGVWGSTFAEVAKLPSNNGFTSSTTTVAGVAIGGDAALSDSINGGILGGYAQARFDQNSAADHSSPSGFGGIYANYGDLFSMAILAGTSKGGYTREILNNTVLGGVVRNEADRNGLFVAPELTARTPKFELGGIKVQASARGRMIFEKLDGVVENANGVSVRVDDTTNRTYEGRVQLGFELIDNATTSITVKTGLDVRSTSGFDDTQLTVLGQTQQVRQSPRDDQAFGGFIGGALHHQVSDNVDIFAASEIGVMSDVNIAADFSAGIKIKF